MIGFVDRHFVAAAIAVSAIAAGSVLLPVGGESASHQLAKEEQRAEFCRLFDVTEVFSGIAIDQRVGTPLGNGQVERFICLQDELGVLVQVAGRTRAFALSEVSAL
jgi:hypothetical protein